MHQNLGAKSVCQKNFFMEHETRLECETSCDGHQHLSIEARLKHQAMFMLIVIAGHLFLASKLRSGVGAGSNIKSNIDINSIKLPSYQFCFHFVMSCACLSILLYQWHTQKKAMRMLSARLPRHTYNKTLKVRFCAFEKNYSP